MIEWKGMEEKEVVVLVLLVLVLVLVLMLVILTSLQVAAGVARLFEAKGQKHDAPR